MKLCVEQFGLTFKHKHDCFFFKTVDDKETPVKDKCGTQKAPEQLWI